MSHQIPSAIPASALDEEEDEDEDDAVGEARDDERTGTRYNVCCLPKLFLISRSTNLVLVVPCHLCNRIYVCSYASN